MADTHRIFVGFNREFPFGGGNDVIFNDNQDHWIFLDGDRVTTLSGNNLQFL